MLIVLLFKSKKNDYLIRVESATEPDHVVKTADKAVAADNGDAAKAAGAAAELETDRAAGEIGTDGAAGEIGTNGAAGEKGTDGAAADIGTDRAAGEIGTYGAAAEIGTDVAAGEIRTDGAAEEIRTADVAEAVANKQERSETGSGQGELEDDKSVTTRYAGNRGIKSRSHALNLLNLRRCANLARLDPKTLYDRKRVLSE